MHNIKEFIDMNEKDFDSFFNILDNSFPKSERRDYPSQKDLLSISNYRPFVFKENDEVLALMAVWEFSDFVYVEHLAVDSKLRGKGVGSELIRNYLNKCEMKGEEVNRADVAASFQEAVVDVLSSHGVEAAKELGYKKLAIAGGVASNGAFRAKMIERCKEAGIEFYHPSPIFCTDNAAMIGVCGYYDYINGVRSGLDLNAVPGLKIGTRQG